MKSTAVLKGLRSKRMMSQENVAKLLNVSRQTYNSLENDLLNNDFKIVFKLLEVLGLSENETEEFFDALKQDYLSYKYE